MDCKVEENCPYSAKKIYIDAFKRVSTPFQIDRIRILGALSVDQIATSVGKTLLLEILEWAILFSYVMVQYLKYYEIIVVVVVVVFGVGETNVIFYLFLIWYM